jgi:hypothetical protein
MNATSRLSLSSLATTIGLQAARGLEGGGELRSPIEGVGTLAGLDLDELLGDREGLGGGERLHGAALGVEPKARTALGLGRDAVVGDHGGGHGVTLSNG